jgi:hypothetical protein
MDTFDDLVKTRYLLWYVQRTDSLNDSINFLGIVEQTYDLYGENLNYVLINIKICCYDLVGMNFKTLEP